MSEELFRSFYNALVKEKNAQATDEDLELYHESTDYWATKNYHQIALWVNETLSILNHPSDYKDIEAFINFYGIIADAELTDFFEVLTRFFGLSENEVQEFADKLSDQKMSLYIRRFFKAKDLVELINRDFEEEEKCRLRFIRNRFCHPTLSDYSAKLNNKNKPLKTYKWQKYSQLDQTVSENDFRKSLQMKLKAKEKELNALRSIAINISKG